MCLRGAWPSGLKVQHHSRGGAEETSCPHSSLPEGGAGEDSLYCDKSYLMPFDENLDVEDHTNGVENARQLIFTKWTILNVPDSNRVRI